jgi:hypothetical protein
VSAQDDRQGGSPGKHRRPSESERIVTSMLEVINRAPNNASAEQSSEEFPRPRAGLFHTLANEAWARVPVGDHVECHAVRSDEFVALLERNYYHRTGDTPARAELAAAVRRFDAQARFDCPIEEVSLRLAGDQRAIIIDLGDDRWRSVAVTASGIHVLDYHPVAFRRSASMLPLPEPNPNRCDLTPLRALHSTFDRDENWALTLAWMLGCYRPWGSYAVYSVTGEANSGKSSMARVITSIVDPAQTALRSLPNNRRDLTAASRHAQVLSFDNVSAVPGWCSDYLCRLSTRAAEAERRYFTNSGEHFIKIGCPVLLTSIPAVVTAEDLRDRTLVVNFDHLPDEIRQTDMSLARWIKDQGPALFGGLLVALKTGLGRLPSVVPSRKTRMLDHQEWALACAPALGLSEATMTAAHVDNRDRGAVDAVVDSPLGASLIELLEDVPLWEGTAGSLLRVLEGRVPTNERRGQAWLRSPRALSSALRRLATDLRRTGMRIVFDRRGHAHARIISITRGGRPSAPSASAAGPGESKGSPDVN